MTQTGIGISYVSNIEALALAFDGMKGLPLFYVEIDRDEIWQVYLDSFSEADRQEHNCNSCKAFLRQYGGIIAIGEEGQYITLWAHVNQSLHEYIIKRAITDRFYTDQKKAGTFKNFDAKRELFWQHMYLELPASTYVRKDVDSIKAVARDDKAVLKRSLDELTLDATETVLELIAQNSLYRGKEHESTLKAFALLQRQYIRCHNAEWAKDNFAWAATADSTNKGLMRIRNTAIGTLLIDLSSGVDLDTAVTKFEAVVAPHNYKRPTALVTEKMVEQARQKLEELGLTEALNRRYARETDVRVCDVLFKDKPTSKVNANAFDLVAKDAKVDTKTFSKLEEITIDNFIANIPALQHIDLYLENTQLNNMVSLITSNDNWDLIENENRLFKWRNPFSLSYTGAVADSIKERVKAAGGNVSGALRCSLSWSNYDDLDIHVIEPNRNRIYYGNRSSAYSDACLDVDMNAGMGRSKTPVENIVFPYKGKMSEGLYKVIVHQFSKRESKDQGYEVQIEFDGQTYNFSFAKNPSDNASEEICQFTYSKKDGIKFDREVGGTGLQKEKWGLKTGQFHKVTHMFLSPNHWGGEYGIGNKHTLFMLENCISDEKPRPFFNEFLKEELNEHRKVFEILAGKIQIAEDDQQLSGVGFSHNASFIVRVTGKFQRLLRVVV